MKKSKRKPTRRSDCPLSFALDVFGDKWSLLIVRDVALRGKTSYGDFLASEEKIATNILADRLALLRRTGIVHRTADPEDKRRDVYALTGKGLALLPALLEITLWGAKYDPEHRAPKWFIAQARKDRVGLVKRIAMGLKHQEFLLPESRLV